jgi:hypothetical protein
MAAVCTLSDCKSAGAVFMTTPLHLGIVPAKAQNLKMAQGVDVQIGRDDGRTITRKERRCD